MKKIVALLCLLALVLPLCACASASIAPAEEAKTATAEEKTEAIKEEKGEIEVIRPLEPLNISAIEKDPKELERVYQLGRAEGKKYIGRRNA